MSKFENGDKVVLKAGLTVKEMHDTDRVNRVGGDYPALLEWASKVGPTTVDGVLECGAVHLMGGYWYRAEWLELYVEPATENPFKLPFGYVCKSGTLAGKVVTFMGYYQNTDGTVSPVYGLRVPYGATNHYDIEFVHTVEGV